MISMDPIALTWNQTISFGCFHHDFKTSQFTNMSPHLSPWQIHQIREWGNICFWHSFSFHSCKEDWMTDRATRICWRKLKSCSLCTDDVFKSCCTLPSEWKIQCILILSLSQNHLMPALAPSVLHNSNSGCTKLIDMDPRWWVMPCANLACSDVVSAFF